MSVQAVHNTHPSPDPQAEAARLKKACVQFEAMFIAQMLKTMRQGSQLLSPEEKQDGLGLGGDNPYQEMFDWELAVKLSERSPLGLAKVLERRYEGQAPLEPSAPDPSGSTPAKPTPLHLPGGLEQIIGRAAAEHDLDPKLIQAVIAAESGGNAGAVSPKGAKGLMQLMDSTATDMGVEDPLNPAENVRGGAAYLRRMLDRYRGNRALALAAYNAGPGAVDRYGGVPPYPETVAYVRKVLQHLSRPATLEAGAAAPDKEML